jgi:4-amino-4-deoxychorismate lyase
VSGVVSGPAVRILVDGRAGACVSALDRGLAYGDGVFETIRFVDGRAPLWQGHIGRMERGCKRLGLALPPADRLLAECESVVADMAHAVVRITWTRGVGERGYAIAKPMPATRIVAAFPLASVPPHWYVTGMRVRLCGTRLAKQPLLAGIKHLNRLEQVLARAEWDDPAIDEGLMLDEDDRVIGATAANLFVVIDGVLATPALEGCGVAGVLRGELLARAPVVVRDIRIEELQEADEVFLSNAVRGIVPVGEWGAKRWAPGPVTRDLLARTRDWFAANGDPA